jgi:hypothetical protein
MLYQDLQILESRSVGEDILLTVRHGDQALVALIRSRKHARSVSFLEECLSSLHVRVTSLPFPEAELSVLLTTLP